MGFYTERILPWLMDKALWMPEIEAQRRPLLEKVSGQVLEIGFGSGASLPAYNSGADGVQHLVALEPNWGMMCRAQDRLSRVSFRVDLVRASAEILPFKDHAFDTVVSNLTLCSIPDLPTALSSLRRVLHPEGRFLFLEHGRADNTKLARWQDRLTPINRLLTGGCRLNRPLDRLIRGAGFELESLERYRGGPGPKLSTQMYRGVARPVG